MKDPVLEGKLQEIETQEKQRRVRAAVILSRRKSNGKRSRKAVMRRMMQHARQLGYAMRREACRPMFGSEAMRGKLLRPDPQPELSYQP